MDRGYLQIYNNVEWNSRIQSSVSLSEKCCLLKSGGMSTLDKFRLESQGVPCGLRKDMGSIKKGNRNIVVPG